MRRGLPGAVLLAALAGFVQAEPNCTDHIVPSDVLLAGQRLPLRGAGVREATWLAIDVYIAALYAPATANGALLLSADTPRLVRLTMLRDVAADEMRANVKAGFARAAGTDLPQQQRSLLERLLLAIPPLQRGDEFAISHRPQGQLSVSHAGRVVFEASNAAFARALFDIWLGERPIAESLKRALLGEPC